MIAYLADARFGVSIDFSITLSIRIVNSGTPTPTLSAHTCSIETTRQIVS